MQQVLCHAEARSYVGDGAFTSALEQPNSLTLELFRVLLPLSCRLRFHELTPRIPSSLGVQEIRGSSSRWGQVAYVALNSVGVVLGAYNLGKQALASRASTLVEPTAGTVGELVMAFKGGSKTGHNKIGINTGDGPTVWFDMTVTKDKGLVLADPRGYVGATRAPGSGYASSSVQIGAEQAQAALEHARAITGEKWYMMGISDCASTARSIAGAAGLKAPATTFTPAQNLRWFESLGNKPPPL
jgi:hypothetical protein